MDTTPSETETQRYKCIAYLEDGRVCGNPATVLDRVRGGMICAAHMHFQEFNDRVDFLERFLSRDEQRASDEYIERAEAEGA